MRTPQPSLFDAPLPRGEKPQAQGSTTETRKGHQKAADTTNSPKAKGEHQPTQARKAHTVPRGKNYKPHRHPNRPVPKKKIVSSRPVRLLALPDGPTGHIVDSITANGQRYVSVQWEHRPVPSLHNPMYLVPVIDKE